MYFEKLLERAGTGAEPELSDHLVLTMKAMGLDPEDGDAAREFVQRLRKVTAASLKTASARLTAKGAKAVVLGTKAAAQEG